MRKTKCEACGRQAPSFEIVEYGSMENRYKQACRRCFNSEAATAAGVVLRAALGFGVHRSGDVAQRIERGGECPLRRIEFYDGLVQSQLGLV